jgi:hypothetical protein
MWSKALVSLYCFEKLLNFLNLNQANYSRLQCMLNADTSISILHAITTWLPHLESKWLVSLQEFLHYISSSIELCDDGPYNDFTTAALCMH